MKKKKKKEEKDWTKFSNDKLVSMSYIAKWFEIIVTTYYYQILHTRLPHSGHVVFGHSIAAYRNFCFSVFNKLWLLKVSLLMHESNCLYWVFKHFFVETRGFRQ